MSNWLPKITPHGYVKTATLKENKLYNSWYAMLNRCFKFENPSFDNYGGRGIQVCARWSLDFKFFFEDMSPTWFPEATLDRKDINGHYNKENCRWLTHKDQQAGRRNVKTLTLDGITTSFRQHYKRLGISRYLLRKKLL
jgi:hypothetical protein